MESRWMVNKGVFEHPSLIACAVRANQRGLKQKEEKASNKLNDFLFGHSYCANRKEEFQNKI